MIKIFYGDDRKAAETAAKKALGANFEVLEGANLEVAELPSIFLGGTLFASERALLIKDLGENKPVMDEMAKYLETPHKVVIWESKLDKRTAFYKEVKDKVEIREFALPKENGFGIAKDIYNMAKRDGAKAVEMTKKSWMTRIRICFLVRLRVLRLRIFLTNREQKKRESLRSSLNLII